MGIDSAFIVMSFDELREVCPGWSRVRDQPEQRNSVTNPLSGEVIAVDRVRYVWLPLEGDDEQKTKQKVPRSLGQWLRNLILGEPPPWLRIHKFPHLSAGFIDQSALARLQAIITGCESHVAYLELSRPALLPPDSSDDRSPAFISQLPDAFVEGLAYLNDERLRESAKQWQPAMDAETFLDDLRRLAQTALRENKKVYYSL